MCVTLGSQVVPCCQFEAKSIPPIHLKGETSSLEDILNSQTFQNLRDKSIRGEPIEGCHKCDSVEKSGLHSLRKWANECWPLQDNEELQISPSTVKYLEVFVGSVCNLKCVMCGPRLSTAWRADYQKLGWQFSEGKEEQVADYQSLLPQLSGLEEIKFVGGEPFLSQIHESLLMSISPEAAKKVRLVYYTNATTMPKPEMIEKFKAFKEVHIWLSIDGYGALNEYIRFPSRWSVIDQNAREYLKLSTHIPSLQIGVHTTASLYNIFSLAPIHQWFEQLKKETQATSRLVWVIINLSHPEFLCVQHLPDSLKPKAIALQDTECRFQARLASVLKEPSQPAFFKKFLDYTADLDRIRGVSLESVIPEFSKIESL